MATLVDITPEITIRIHHVRSNDSNPELHGSVRMTMLRYTGKKWHPIGVWKSKGWDLEQPYTIVHTAHPVVKTDDSWFRVMEVQDASSEVSNG